MAGPSLGAARFPPMVCGHCGYRFYTLFEGKCPVCLQPPRPPRAKRSPVVTLMLAASDARQAPAPDDFHFLASHPGNPLGHGMPLGAPLRTDGETHRDAWKRILRSDPCAYCGGLGGTVDHIVPQSAPNGGGYGGLHSWINYSGACSACNGSKGAKHLLRWLRTGHRPRRVVA